MRFSPLFLFFFFNDTATTEIYTLSLHDALPIFPLSAADLPPSPTKSSNLSETAEVPACNVPSRSPYQLRSEERFSRNAETDLVCRLLLEKKKYPSKHTPSGHQFSATRPQTPPTR